MFERQEFGSRRTVHKVINISSNKGYRTYVAEELLDMFSTVSLTKRATLSFSQAIAHIELAINFHMPR